MLKVIGLCFVVACVPVAADANCGANWGQSEKHIALGKLTFMLLAAIGPTLHSSTSIMVTVGALLGSSQGCLFVLSESSLTACVCPRW
jgi:hypothetical protein